LNSNTEEANFFKELLFNTDNNSYFYEGTGIVTIHSGGISETGDCYDTGIVTISGTDYMYVIYAKKTTETREDILKDISAIFYDDIS
jgi:hypothetical protein